MARIVDGPQITGQVVHKQTGQAYGPVTVTVSKTVYSDPEMQTGVTTLTTNGQGVFSCYAQPGTYTFTTTAVDAAPIEAVEVLGRELGINAPGSAASLAVKDEGTTAVAAATALNFVGAGVTASDGGSGTATVTVPGGASANVYVTQYGAKADAKTLWSGVTTSGNATLTDATAPFTSADVGKVIVVNNGVSNGTHLYTTIATFTDTSHVTLTVAPTNSINPACYTYGTNDTAAWNSAIAACVEGGSVGAPNTPSLVTSAIDTGTKALTILGFGVSAIFGPYDAAHASVVMPSQAPFLAGSVLVQAGANQDGFKGSMSGKSVNFQNLGVYFAGMFKTTGYGFNYAPPLLSGGARGNDNGLCGANWWNLHVMGNDATHYGVYVLNTLNSTFSQINSYGGGGFAFDDNSTVNPYGNSVMISLFNCRVTGTLAGILAKGNQNEFVRPQGINGSSFAGTIWANWNLVGGTNNTIDVSGGNNTHFTAADIEDGPINIGSASNVEFTAGGTPYPLPTTITTDNAPFFRRLNAQRRVNADGTVSLDGLENSTSLHWLLNDTVTGRRWGIATDGSNQIHVPGRIHLLGGGVYATAAAGIGTSPPLMRAVGTDAGGSVIFGSGTSTAAGDLVTLTLGDTYPTPPKVIVTPGNAATAALGAFYARVTASTITVGSQSAPTASQGVGTYVLHFMVINSGPASSMGIYDTFTRADTSAGLGTTTSGTAWTALAGTIGITSNQAVWVSNGASNALSTVPVGQSDFQLDVDLVTNTGGGGVLLRASDTNNYIYTNTSVLGKKSGGSFSTLKSFSSGFGNGDHITVVCDGYNIVVRKNGKAVASVQETFNQSQQTAGLRADTTGMVWDNFVVGG